MIETKIILVKIVSLGMLGRLSHIEKTSLSLTLTTAHQENIKNKFKLIRHLLKESYQGL
jgi:hypothetical protein